MIAPTLIEILIWTAAGLGLGAVYLHLVGRSVAAIVAPGSGSIFAAAGWLVLRAALAATVFGAAAMNGVAPLLLALAGFLAVRTVLLRRAKGT